MEVEFFTIFMNLGWYNIASREKESDESLKIEWQTDQELLYLQHI